MAHVEEGLGAAEKRCFDLGTGSGNFGMRADMGAR